MEGIRGRGIRARFFSFLDARRRIFGALIESQDAVIDCIGALGIVDGHDVGSGERDIFVATDQPESAYRCIKSVFESKHVMTDVKVACRKAGGWEYKTLHPPGIADFTVFGDE